MKSIPSDSGVRSPKLSQGELPGVVANDAHLNALLGAYTANDIPALLRSIEEMLQSKGVRFNPPAVAVDEDTKLEAFAERYRRKKAKKWKAATMDKARLALTSFVKMFKGVEVRAMQPNNIECWLEDMAQRGFAPGTMRTHFSIVFAMFQRAVALGLLKKNPCLDVEIPDEESVVNRLPISDDDFGKLLGVVNDEWRTCCLLMRHSRARLGDAAKMDCAAVVVRGDIVCLCYEAVKGRKFGTLPVFEPLASHLRQFAGKQGPMCPELAGKTVSCLSKRFAVLLEAAGIDRQPVELPSGRSVDRISAHSLRHAFCDGMDKLGIPEDLRMLLSAHSSRRSHRSYIHVDPVDLHGRVSKFFP